MHRLAVQTEDLCARIEGLQGSMYSRAVSSTVASGKVVAEAQCMWWRMRCIGATAGMVQARMDPVREASPYGTVLSRAASVGHRQMKGRRLL